MPPITTYRFKFRISPDARFSQTRRSMTLHDAAQRFGEGNYEPMEYTKGEQKVRPENSAPGVPKGE